MILGLIPARGGSKGVPRKNLKLVRGKPLLAYAVECGLACPSLDKLVVSTEDAEIAAEASKWGAETPFVRPAELAADEAPMLPVMRHALEQCETFWGQEVEILVLIDPTAPLRLPEDVEGALELLKKEKAQAVVSGAPAHRNPYFNMVRRDDSGRVRIALDSGQEVTRRQDAPELFDLNTVVWAYRRQALMVDGRRMPVDTVLYITPPERCLDLDTPFDFELLEFLLARREMDK